VASAIVEDFFTEILWLMQELRQRTGLEKGGVAAAQILAGYFAEAKQSRTLGVANRHRAGQHRFLV